MKGKIVFFVVIFGVVFAAGSVLIKGRKETYPEKALQQLSAGNFASAEEELRQNADGYLFPLSLYQGFLAQARHRFSESEYFFQTVLKHPPAPHHTEALFETYLAQMMNAYLQQQDQKLSPLLDQAKQFSTGNCVLLFFDGLNAYIQNRYSEALRYWIDYPTATSQVPESRWMPHMIDRFFPTAWRQLHIAHCLAEEGDIEASRAILEKEQHQLNNQNSDYHHLATLFLGLTYLKESADVPTSERTSYYKLAQFYFERAEKLKPFHREQGTITAHIQHEIELLLSNLSEQEEREWAFAFIRTLVEWKAHEQLENIAGHIVQMMCQEQRHDQSMYTFCQDVKKEFGKTVFYEALTQKLHAALVTSIQHAQMDQIVAIWELAEALASSPQSIARQVAHLTQNEMFKTIYLDDDLLHKTRSYLRFWNQLKQDRSSYEQMACDLFRQATLFWKKEGQEQKGLHLMEIAMKLCPEKREIERGIELFLTNLYKEAESSNMVYRLGLVHDALLTFGFGVEKSLEDHSKLANHLADAEYLYHVRNYAAAKTHATWVLKHDGDNQQAIRLIGLSAFQMGEYRAALLLLGKLNMQDISVQKAIAFSLAYSNQEDYEHIVRIDVIDTFDADK